MQFMTRLFNRQNIIWLLLLLMTLPAFTPLLRTGFFSMQDDLQAFRIQQLDRCIQDGQIPCRWVPDAGFQYGYPQFVYYPPSVYYLGEMFHLAGFQFIDSVKILFVLGFVLAALTMFVFLRTLFSPWAALIGSVLYTYAPYKAVDVYVRGAMSEFWSFVFFPLIFWASYQLIATKKNIYLAWLSLSVGLLLLTHNLMSMIFLPVAALWALLWVWLQKEYRVLPKLFLGAVLGVGVAAFFTLPVVWEKQYSHSESMLGGYFDYRQHFADLSQIFISNHWGYGSSELGPGDDLSLSTGHLLWISALVGLVLAALNFTKSRNLAITASVLAGMDLFILFMVHQKSSFIWEKLPILVWLQFPWRLLADSVFILAFLAGLAVYLTGKTSKFMAYLTGAALIVLTFILYIYPGFFTPKDWLNISDRDKFSGVYWEKELTISIFDYLPIYAKLPPNRKAPDLPEVLSGRVEFLNYQKGSDFQKSEFVASEESVVRLPLFDFPGMEVKVDGQKVLHHHDNCINQEYCLGLISLTVSKGRHTMEARLGNTPVRAIGNIISVVSILAVGGIALQSRRKR